MTPTSQASSVEHQPGADFPALVQELHEGNQKEHDPAKDQY